MRHFISSVSLALGWFLMILAVVGGLLWAMSLPSLHRIQDFGIQSAHVTHTMLWLLPLLAISSASLLCCSHRATRRLYLVLLGVTILVWGVALWDFRFHPAHPIHQPVFPTE